MSEIIAIEGGHKLNGTVEISGAKNATVALIPAIILADSPVTIYGVPEISDVDALAVLLEELNCTVLRSHDSLIVDPSRMENVPLVSDAVDKLRASYYLMGALLGKCKKVVMKAPGGCFLGPRPIDLHIKGFEALGAKVEFVDGAHVITADRLVGAKIYLDFASVGATINILLAAVKAEGKTVIENAAKEPEIIDVVNLLTKMGAKIPRGVLLYGKPGTGKTLIAKAIAGEANVPFISMSGSEFVEMFVGLGASRVRKLFEKARKLAPCIVFIDEIDAIGARRTGNSGGESENNQTLNQLLVEMDGFSSEETIIVLAATNRPEMLDKALLRPGRFDRQITIPAPDIRGRLEILKIHAKDKKVSDDVNLESIAEDTAGFTGAELANILNEAAIIATINKHEEIENDDIEEAVKKVTVGLEKKERVISDKDKKLTAYHEAGHAVVGRYLPTQSNVKEVSIIPRGVAGGYTMYKSDEDKYYISKTEMQERLTALLGGRAAEKLVLNDISTGASNDIEVATNIARDMVTKYGMSDVLGPIDFKGKEPYEMQLFGENIGDKIGQEVKLLIDTAYERAQQLLIEHRDKLEIIAQTLLEREKINETEFNKIFEEEN